MLQSTRRDHRDELEKVKFVYMCACVWAQDSDQRVCVCLAEKIAGTSVLKAEQLSHVCILSPASQVVVYIHVSPKLYM